MSNRSKAIRELNERASKDADARLQKAAQCPTLDEAVSVYGRAERTFWRHAIKRGMREELRTKWAADLKARRIAHFEANRGNFETGRATQSAETSKATAALIEDAEWLAVTGETREGAVRRLGFDNWEALYTRLSNHGRRDITDRLTANGDPVGRVRQGSISRSTNGARL